MLDRRVSRSRQAFGAGRRIAVPLVIHREYLRHKTRAWYIMYYLLLGMVGNEACI